MRVAIFADSWFPAVDGVSVSVRADMQNLRAQGHDVVLHTPRIPDIDRAQGAVRPWTSAGVPHYPSHAFAFFPPASFLREARGYDLIYFHGVTPFLGYTAIAASRTWGVPLLWRFTTYVPDYVDHVQNFLDAHLKKKFGNLAGGLLATGIRNATNLVFGTMAKWTSHVVVPNQFCADYVRTLTKAEIVIVPPRPLPPGPVDGDPMRAIAPRGKRVILLSRLSGEKNLKLAIDAFSTRVLAQVPDAHLIVLGDGPERIALEQYSRPCPSVHFLGLLPNERVHGHLVYGDVFLYTSLSETHGLVVEEAKRGGLPIVAFDDRRGVAHQVSAAECGILAPAGDVAALGDATVRLLRDEPLRREMGRRAQEHQARESRPVPVFFPDLYL